MIENLLTRINHIVNKHLRPADLPKTLYLPGAELFYDYMNRALAQTSQSGRVPYTYWRIGRSTERPCTQRESRCISRPFAQHDSESSRSPPPRSCSGIYRTPGDLPLEI